jgi:hypothetical protein
VYDQYRWRYHQRQAEHGQAATTAAAAGAAPAWAGLVNDDSWQARYFTPGPEQRELAFWLPPGQPPPTVRSPAASALSALVSAGVRGHQQPGPRDRRACGVRRNRLTG